MYFNEVAQSSHLLHAYASFITWIPSELLVLDMSVKLSCIAFNILDRSKDDLGD